MQFGVDKCAYMYIERGKRKSLGEMININGVKIKELEEGDTYKYLGQDESVGYDGPINKERVLKEYLKPWSNELDFSQCNMQHLSSGKSRDRLTTLFIHVETYRNMLYVVERSLIGIKNVASTNVVQQYISFVSEVRA